MHTGARSTAVKLRHNMQIQEVIADNMPKINTINFMPKETLFLQCTHMGAHMPTPKGLIISKNFVGPKQKLSLREKSEGEH